MLQYNSKKIGAFHRVTVLICLIVALLCSASFLLADFLFQRDLAARTEEINSGNRNMARFLEENVRRTFSQADNILLFVKSGMESHGFIEGDRLGLLKGFLSMGMINQIAVADAAGDLVLGLAPSQAPITIADREYFRAHLPADTGTLYIASPYISRTTGLPTIFLSRRLNDSAGNFAGTATVGLDPNYFSRIFRDLELGPGNTITLLRTDGVLLATVPGDISASATVTLRDHPVFSYLRQGQTSGVFQVTDSADKVTRQAAFVAFPDYPVVILVTNSREEAFKDVFSRRLDRQYWAGGFSFLLVAAFSVVLSQMRKQHDTAEELKHANYHDQLTGLYNRAFFYEKLEELKAGEVTSCALMVVDVDGLKVVNDTFGHEAGDRMLSQAAKVLIGCFGGSDAIVARVGGDEFAIMITRADKKLVESLHGSVQQAVEEYNAHEANHGLPLQLSLGYALPEGRDISPEELLAEADKVMYREKLRQASSRRGQIITTLTEMLSARDYITEGHASRVQEITVLLAVKAGIEPSKIPDVELFAHFHDIGKVGVPDRILNKRGPLSAAERQEIQLHSEIGHRIARTTEDLLPIADWILKHHERWDGSGYPLGLSGKVIPLECRILAIADAFDAMTNDRPYRKAMSKEEAFAELKKNAGTQFDPHLVQLFEDLIMKNA